MTLTPKEVKQRYFDKIYQDAEIIKCKCGCGKELKNKDKYGRNNEGYINGHNGRKYKDPTQYKREWNHRNRKARKIYVDKYLKKRKIELIKILGGKCEICNLKYNGENGCLFQFHHKNPSEKEIKLNLAFLWKKWDNLLNEIKKCKLVCSNCHFLIHGDKY